MPKLIYLDSNDFSDLSVPFERITSEDQELLEELRIKNRSQSATFFMSAVHLSEAVHAADTHKALAVRRAELMNELCQGRILRFPTEIIELEIEKILNGEQSGRLSIDEL